MKSGSGGVEGKLAAENGRIDGLRAGRIRQEAESLLTADVVGVGRGRMVMVVVRGVG